MVELCTYSSHRLIVISLLPESCGPSILRVILPSSLGRIWTKLAFLRTTGLCVNESNCSENKTACVKGVHHTEFTLRVI